MMEQKPEMTDAELDAFFAAEKAVTPELRPEILERIAGSAISLQSEPQVEPEPSQIDWIGRLAGMLGGWRAASALTACAIAGVYVGYSFPVEDLLTNYSVAGVEAEQAYDLSGLLDPEFSFLEG